MNEYGAIWPSPPGFEVRLATDERELLCRLLGELRSMLVQPDERAAAALVRLFPVAHPDDRALEDEYQRLMREELVASRLAGIGAVEHALRGPTATASGVVLDEEQLLAFMQALNSVRLVLGTMLGVSDDERDDGIDDVTGVLVPERQLYGFLSWLLDSAVAALSPDDPG